MKILLDECVPARFGRLLTEHSVTTVPRHGWAGIKNGDLLEMAEKEFDAFVTVDRKLGVEQGRTKIDIAVFLLRARTNRFEDIRPLAPALLERLGASVSSGLTVLER